MQSKHLVMVISSLRSGGAERVAVTMANALAQKMRVTVVCFSGMEDAFYPLSKKVSVVYLDLLAPQPWIGAAIKANLQRLGTIRKTVRNLGADLVVSFMLETNVLVILSQLGTKTPLIVCEHTDPGLVQHKLPWRVMRNLGYRLCDRLVVLNEYMKDWFEKAGNRWVWVIPNPIEVNIHSQCQLDTPAPFILGMGRLIPSKSFDQLIDVYARSRPTFPNWQLVIAGDGELKGALQRQIDELGLTENVHLIGNTLTPHNWMKHADIFASTSTIEAFPMAICEAMMVGLPIVAVAYNESAETLIPNTAGFVISTENQSANAVSEHFADALMSLMSDRERRITMGKQAAKSVERYQVKHVISQWEKLFEELVPGFQSSGFQDSDFQDNDFQKAESP
ncbi:MAG: glycosyltransferase [Gammaproteobacteria bacterium]|nr:glycosyltransferase [Gammaproteobacteria bacterium]